MQIVRITGFFFENRLHRQFQVEKISTNGCFGLHIYLRTNKTLIHNLLCVFGKWGKILSHNKMYNYSKKMFTRMAKSIRITSVRISGVLLWLSSTWRQHTLKTAKLIFSYMFMNVSHTSVYILILINPWKWRNVLHLSIRCLGCEYQFQTLVSIGYPTVWNIRNKSSAGMGIP
jgi:hypothetical protein